MLDNYRLPILKTLPMRAITSARVSGGVISGSVCSNLDGHLQKEMLEVKDACIKALR